MTVTTPKLSDEERKERRRISARKWAQNNKDAVNAKRRSDYKSDPTCRKLEQQRYYYKDVEKSRARGRNNNLKHKYGLTQTDWDALFYRQGFCCAICATHDLDYDGVWHTDHCHDTGRVRGILCLGCNTGIGQLKHNVTNLSNAIQYLN
jgi:hypothetical protein